MVLTVSKESIGTRDGQFEVTLDPEGNEYSVLSLLPSDNSKKLGDKVF